MPATSGIGKGSGRQQSSKAPAVEVKNEDAASVQFNEEYAKKKDQVTSEITSEEIDDDKLQYEFHDLDDEMSGDSAAVQIDGIEVAKNYSETIKATEFMKEQDRQAVKGTAAEQQELQEFLELEKQAQAAEEPAPQTTAVRCGSTGLSVQH